MFVLLSINDCKKALLTAPDSATLVVTVSPTAIAVGGQATIRVVGFKASGTPLPDGTKIFFSVNLGSVEPMKQTVDGVAEALFNSSDNRSGVATVTVTSGNAETTPDEITITVGSSALETLSITADPSSLPEGGGTAAIRVVAYDSSLNPLPGVPVVMNTDAGELESKGSVLTTNSNGMVEDRLTTTKTAVVKASSGALEAELTIDVPDGEAPVIVLNISPSNPKVDEKVYFDASGSYDPDGEIVSYKWNFGDGRSGSGETTTHRYSHAGTYNVMLIVEDNNGNRSSDTDSITVNSQDIPTAEFTFLPENPGVNETVYFDASDSFDVDGTIESYKWDFGDGTTGTGRTSTHRYSQNGDYMVTLEVIDDDDNSGYYRKEVPVGGRDKPTARFEMKPEAPRVNETVYFDASGSSDNDGTIESYIWDFGDGISGSGETDTHRFQTEGTYFVKLVVTDNDGNEDSDIQTLVVGIDQGPTAVIEISPGSPKFGETVYFDGSGSTDKDGTIVSYRWDFGDGSTGTGETTTHQYSRAGTYTVTLEVTDDSGNTGSAYENIEVTSGSPPTAVFFHSPTNPVVGETVSFNATESTDEDGTIVSWQWDFGDGGTGSGGITTHSYQASGTYKVILIVTDNDGNTNRAEGNVAVGNNSRPTASFTYTPGSPGVGTTVHFDASDSRDTDGTIVSWQWDFGDGITGSGETITHQFMPAGNYVVILTVKDDNGGTDTAFKTVTVN